MPDAPSLLEGLQSLLALLIGASLGFALVHKLRG
jgi:hypothetical protein